MARPWTVGAPAVLVVVDSLVVEVTADAYVFLLPLRVAK
jgi:hypothetical protein